MKPSVRLAQAKACYSKVMVLSAALVIMCGIFVSCGGNSNPSDVIPAVVSGDLTNADDAGNLPINLQVGEDAPSPQPPALPAGGSPTRGEGEEVAIEPDYSGRVVIKFKDGTDVRLRPEDRDGPPPEADSPLAKFVSLSGADVSGVNELLEARLQSGESSPAKAGLPKSGVQGITRAMTASEEEIDRWLSYWRKQGVTLHDWNLYYYIEVPEYEDAKSLVRGLNENTKIRKYENTGVVDYAEILPVFYLTSVTTPDMSDEQDYLKSASTGGLGVEDAWAKLDAMFPDIKLRGQNTMVVDQEYDWNFDHEILPIDETGEYLLDPGIGTWGLYDKDPSGGAAWGKNVPANIEHGTAVVGIIAGQGNDISKAIKGIVPSTTARVSSIDGATCGIGLFGESKMPVGSVFTIEIQQKGITTGTSGCSVGDGISSSLSTGCVPLEALKYTHQVITDCTNAGSIIVEGAGNGGADLDNDDLAKPKEGTFSHFSDPANDSGAIMVGASLGANKQKAAWSNCGSRVDVFAWGAGVVTAGYGDKYNPDGADPNVIGPNGADNPKLYTGQFGGTSAATAQIAGVAAMIQSYVRQLVAEAGKINPKQIYLDSKQIRTILKNSGQPAVYGQTPNDPNPNCNIGIQPDLALAIDRTNDFLNGTGIFADGKIYEKEGVDNKVKIVPLNSGTGLDGKKVIGPHGINYDMDGDKRAEIISFSRDHKWYIDLSSVSCSSGASCGDDGYGEWDLVLEAGSTMQEAGMVFPVVHDYNSDGKADLALYDSINGKWYIKYTTLSVITPSPLVGEGGGEGALEWDRVIDYTADPAWKAYSRPVPGDYDGDNWLDPALQSPDGHWLIDYGGIDGVFIDIYEGFKYTDHFGSFDKDVKYLTDEQLAQAPGWAWLGIVTGTSSPDIIAKNPDGIINENSIVLAPWPNFDISEVEVEYPQIYGDNSIYFTNFYGCDVATKDSNGIWKVFPCGTAWSGDGTPPLVYEPNGIFGDINCRPVPADYDGDEKDDRAVQCGTLWKIAYSSEQPNLREIELDQVLDPLPAFVYPGGIKYQDTVDLYNYYQSEINCQTKNCTIFDAPPPVGPYFAQCVKYWAPNASYCWDK